MSPEDLERVKSAHVRARSLLPGQRAEFLQSQFPDEPELRTYTEQLLEWNDEAGEFLNAPLTAELLDLSPRELNSQRLGPWELIGELGRGGTATVHLARRADDLYEKQVAIKVLNRLSHSPEVFRRFQRELQILARVEHDYIVRLLEAGVTDQALAYIVTEYVDGKRIDEFAATLPLREKLQLFVKVCDAVSFAHQRHILHRDLKPSNILVTEPGTPKLLDFGIAVLLDRDSRLTETGLERLTMQYASPEQVRNEKQITPASDLYSLGVILYELVAGHSPYGGVPHELAAWILAKDPLPLSGAPKELQAIVGKALRKPPAERYACVQDLKDDLTRFLDGSPIVARRPGRLHRFGRSVRIHWRPVSLVAAGVALGVIVAIATHRDHKPENHAMPLALEADEGRPLSFGFSPDGRRLFYVAGDAYFDYMDLYVKDLDRGKAKRLTTDGVFKLGPAVSRDGTLVAFLRAASERTTTLVILPAHGGAERRLFTAPSGSFTWGPDNRLLIVGHRSERGIWPQLRGFDIEKNAWWEITPAPTEGRGDGSPALSPDGHTICFVRQESRESADLFLLPVDVTLHPTGMPRRLTSRRLRIISPQWTPDGKEIVYAGGTLGNYRVFRVAADGRSEPREVVEARSGVQSLAIPRHARSLIVGRWATTSNLWRFDFAEPGGPILQRKRVVEFSDAGSFSPDGKLISYVSDRSGEPQAWVADADGSAGRQVTSYPASDGLSALWLPDGSGLVTSVRSRNLGLRNFIVPLPSGPERELAGVKGAPCAFSRDGQWLYFSLIAKDVDIYKYSMKTGEVRQVTVDARGSHATHSPDEKFVYFSKPESELGLWRIPVDGGVPQQVLPNLARRTLFHVFDQGIFYVARESRASVLKLRRFSKGGDVDLYRTTAPPGWSLSFSPDLRHLLYGQEDVSTSEVLLVSDFR